ncbi:MAG: hypothetical protein INR69_12690 [Mucilaginibacter polytrichastri]|nr:hypothetical protein [Mucilaginibacter polytrichastri]
MNGHKNYSHTDYYDHIRSLYQQIGLLQNRIGPGAGNDWIRLQQSLCWQNMAFRQLIDVTPSLSGYLKSHRPEHDFGYSLQATLWYYYRFREQYVGLLQAVSGYPDHESDLRWCSDKLIYCLQNTLGVMKQIARENSAEA